MIKKFEEFIKESFEFQDVEVDDLNSKELCKYLNKLYTYNESGLRHFEPGHGEGGIKCDEDGNILVEPLNNLSLIFSESKRIFAIIGKGGLRQHKKDSVARLFDALQEKYFVLKDVYMDETGNETTPDDENALKCTEITLKAGPMINRIFIVLIDFILNFKRSGKQLLKFHRRIPTMVYDFEHTDVNELEPDELMNYITNKYEFLNPEESIFCTVDGNEYYYHIPVHNRDTDSFPIGNVSHLLVNTKNNNIINLMLQIDGYEWGSSMEERSLLNIFKDKYRLHEDYICDGGVLGYYFDGDLGRHKFSNEFVLGIIDMDIENVKNPILRKK